MNAEASPLPDGDMIIVGNHGGAVEIRTDGTRLFGAWGARDTFLARPSPEGAVRWSHVIGGNGPDQVGTATVTGGAVWLALGAYGLSVALDANVLDRDRWRIVAGSERVLHRVRRRRRTAVADWTGLD